MDKERANMICNINEVSFALDELRLFLDTHPNNAQAMQMYNEQVKAREKMLEDYVRVYGPLRHYDFNDCNTWKWVVHPWPWEGVF